MGKKLIRIIAIYLICFPLNIHERVSDWMFEILQTEDDILKIFFHQMQCFIPKTVYFNFLNVYICIDLRYSLFV